jgi:DNA-directed RNA polymerase alpha subunit
MTKATTEINIDYYEELERLARIGRATENAFEKCEEVIAIKYWYPEEREERYVDDSYSFDAIEDLLEWVEGE